MFEVKLSAGCKVNLGLAITGRLENGYHLLDSFFYPLSSPADELMLREQKKPGLSVSCSEKEIDPEKNTLTKIYQLVCDQGYTLPGCSLFLKKGIPIGSGLGGGSSDAAVFLNFLDSFFDLKLGPSIKTEIAKKTGADVPFFLDPIPARIQGIGEIILPASLDIFPCHLLLLCPKIQVNTREAYLEYDRICAKGRPNGLQALTKKDFARSVRISHAGEVDGELWSFDNSLEEAVLPQYPELPLLKKRLADLGAYIVGMSGSGASLYALFPPEEEEICRAAWSTLSADGHSVFISHLT